MFFRLPFRLSKGSFIKHTKILLESHSNRGGFIFLPLFTYGTDIKLTSRIDNHGKTLATIFGYSDLSVLTVKQTEIILSLQKTSALASNIQDRVIRIVLFGKGKHR